MILKAEHFILLHNIQHVYGVSTESHLNFILNFSANQMQHCVVNQILSLYERHSWDGDFSVRYPKRPTSFVPHKQLYITVDFFLTLFTRTKRRFLFNAGLILRVLGLPYTFKSNYIIVPLSRNILKYKIEI